MKSRFNQQELFEQGLHGCCKCKEIKLIEEFSRNKTKNPPLSNECKQCSSEKHKLWYKANTEIHKIKSCVYKRNNPEKAKKWDKANPEKVKEYKRKNYYNNFDLYSHKNKLWHKSNPEKSREIKRKHENKSTVLLAESYIKKTITNNYDLHRSDIPQELIDHKRIEIQLKRVKKQFINQLKSKDHE